jgi:hypothetical protein
MTLTHPAERSVTVSYAKKLGTRTGGPGTQQQATLNTLISSSDGYFDYISINGPAATDLEIQILNSKFEVIDSIITDIAGEREFYLDSEIANQAFGIRIVDINNNDASDWTGICILGTQSLEISWIDTNKNALAYVTFINGVEVIENAYPYSSNEGKYIFEEFVQHNYTDSNTTIVIYGIDKDGKYITTGSVTF